MQKAYVVLKLLAGSKRFRSQQSCMYQVAASWMNGLLLVRYLGDSTEYARMCFTHIWQLIRPSVLNLPACLPRIWNT